MGMVVLTAVIDEQLSWPGHYHAKQPTPRYFGKFASQAEAERWIKEHHWMTEQSLEELEPTAKQD